MEQNKERYSVDVVSVKHAKLNEILLMKSFERYLQTPWKYHNENLCRIINEANIQCKKSLKKGLTIPKKSPSMIIKKNLLSKSPRKKLLNESLRMIAAHQLQLNNSISPKTTPDKSIREFLASRLNESNNSNSSTSSPEQKIRDLLASFRNDSFHQNADNTLIKFSESEIAEVANRSIIDPPPGFQLPRHVPKIYTPEDTPNSTFDRPMHVSTPQRLNIAASRLPSSTPYRLEVTPRNLESSFTVSMSPAADQSSIRRITCNDNFTRRDLTSIIEILENFPNVELNNSNNSISLSSRSLNVTPGSYELFKVFH